MKRSLISALLLTLSLPATATIPVPVTSPVIDVAAIAKLGEQLKQMKEQYELFNKIHQNAESQLGSLNQLKDFNSGAYGYGNLENGLNELKNRQSSANTWDDALKNIAGGNPSRYAELVSAYERAHPDLGTEVLSKGTSPAHLAQYQQHRALNKAASVETTYAFNEVNQHVKSIHTLSSQIEKAPNTKSALDLNSRLIAELAYIEVINLKLQTVISQQLAQSGANELADDSEMIRFNTLPDE
jgi:type IV secretion system protein VirB5